MNLFSRYIKPGIKKLRLTKDFYKSFAFVSWTITFCCMIIMFTWGMRTFTALFWFKIFTLALFSYFIDNYKRDEFYYYKNLGLSRLRLWVSTLAFDFILFNILLFTIVKIR